MQIEKTIIETLPSETGIYMMKATDGSVLYIGKAKNIKERVKQYFLLTAQSRPIIPTLLAHLATIETIVVPTEKAALLLENNLIKKYKPKYNILLKDDKTYISLMLTMHRWPMLKLVRLRKKPRKTKAHYFGPYTSAHAARQMCDLILSIFPLRQCSDEEIATRKRPCLLYELKKCVAPCMGKCTPKEYQDLIEGAVRLLEGKDKKILKTLHLEMQKASEELRFEKAQDLLEKSRQIEHILQRQYVENFHIDTCDVFGLYRDHSTAIVAKLLIREGKLIGSEHFSFFQIFATDEELLESLLMQLYANDTIPHLILPIDLKNKKIIEEALFEKTGKKTSILTPQKGEKKKLIILAQNNAKALFEQQSALRLHGEKLLLSLQETLKLHRFPKIIQCFDTSHTFGTHAVASMVTFIDGFYDKKRVKLFKIKIPQKGDCPALRHVIERHFSKEESFCDLLIVDGGKAQLNAAISTLEKLNIASIDIIAIAKESGKHERGLTKEKIHLPSQKNPILLPPTSSLLFLLQKIRDEAHRLAISYHRKKRKKETISSQLDEIPGIGPIKKRRLLQHFKSIEKIKEASFDELKEIKGLTKKDYQMIRNSLKR